MTAAIRDIAARMQPDDTFVMFYSGHGGQVPRRGGPTASDPDGLDETLALYDGSLLDDELRALFDEIDAGHGPALARLVLQRRLREGHRLGARADGHVLVRGRHHLERRGEIPRRRLSVALPRRRRSPQGLADEDKNNSITAIELSQYCTSATAATSRGTRPSNSCARR